MRLFDPIRTDESHARHNLRHDRAVAVLVLEDDRLLDRIVLGIHRDRAGADREILRLLDCLAERLGIVRTRALQRVDEEFARVVAERGKDIRGVSVFLLIGVDEGAYRLVLIRVMRAEIRPVQRRRARKPRDLCIVPAVRADDGGGDADLARLPRRRVSVALKS